MVTYYIVSCITQTSQTEGCAGIDRHLRLNDDTDDNTDYNYIDNNNDDNDDDDDDDDDYGSDLTLT